MKENLKTELKALYQKTPPMPDSGRINEIMALAKRKTLALPRESSLFWFVRAQIRFTNRKFLVLQLLLLCLYGFFTATVLQDNEGFLLLVPLAPIVVLIGTSEISRSFWCGMTELELPSRFSLPQVLLARLVITAMIDTLSLTCMLVLTAMKTYTTFGALILYGLVPSFLAAAGSLFLINRCRNTNVQYYVSAYCAALSAFGMISVNKWPKWYDGTATAVWLILLLFAIAGFAEEIYKMLNNCSQRLERLALQ